MRESEREGRRPRVCTACRPGDEPERALSRVQRPAGAACGVVPHSRCVPERPEAGRRREITIADGERAQ